MTIAQVSKKYELTQDTLRYYERIGLIPPVPRTESGIRNFDEESCRWVEFVKCMRSAGLSIEVLVEYLGLFKQGEDTVEARKNLLILQREELAKKMEAIKITIERLDYKIENYEGKLQEKERNLNNKK